MFDVLDIEAELINAKIDLVIAQYDKTYAQYRLLSGIGQLVHTLGLQWPEESTVKEDEQMQEKEEAPKDDKSAAAGENAPATQIRSLTGNYSYDSKVNIDSCLLTQ